MTLQCRKRNAVIAFALVIVTFLSSCSLASKGSRNLNSDEDIAERATLPNDSVVIAWDDRASQSDSLELLLKEYFSMRLAALKGEDFTTNCCADALTEDALLRSQKTHWGEVRFVYATVQVTVKEVKTSGDLDTVSLSELTWVGYNDDPLSADVEDEFGWTTEHTLQIDTTANTIVLDSYSEEDVNGHSSQGVCETAQESAIRGNK